MKRQAGVCAERRVCLTCASVLLEKTGDPGSVGLQVLSDKHYYRSYSADEEPEFREVKCLQACSRSHSNQDSKGVRTFCAFFLFYFFTRNLTVLLNFHLRRAFLCPFFLSVWYMCVCVRVWLVGFFFSFSGNKLNLSWIFDTKVHKVSSTFF